VDHELIVPNSSCLLFRRIGHEDSRHIRGEKHLSALLDQLERGEEIVITRRGKAVARLVPVGEASHKRLADTAAWLKAFRRGRRLGGPSAKMLIEEGR
jgi:prevent-host-death family protein